MADIGGVWRRSAIFVWPVGFTAAASSVQASAGWALPLPRKTVGRRIADWALGTADAVRAMFRTADRPSQSKPRYYHPRRESFIEDAAMSREMDRL